MALGTCPTTLHRLDPICRCGKPVTRDDIIKTTDGSYYICGTCWDAGRRLWFRPDTKAERIEAVNRAVAAQS